MKKLLSAFAGIAPAVMASGLLGKMFGTKTEKKFKARGFQNEAKQFKRGEIKSAFHRSEDCW